MSQVEKAAYGKAWGSKQTDPGPQTGCTAESRGPGRENAASLALRAKLGGQSPGDWEGTEDIQQ